MFQDNQQDDEQKRPRSTKASRLRSPRAARSTERKKSSTGFGGKHQRRNKHWSW